MASVQQFQVFDYSIPTGTIASIAGLMNFIWGSRVDHCAFWHAANPSMDISFYFPAWRDYGTFNGRGLDELTLVQWQAFHPEWVLYTSDGVTPAYYTGDPYVPLDFSNAAVVAWQVAQYGTPAKANGNYTYLAADNVTLINQFGAYGIYPNATPASPFAAPFTQLYNGTTTDATYTNNLANWCVNMASALHAIGMKLVINLAISAAQSFTDTAVTTLTTAVDAILDEAGFTSNADHNISGAPWLDRFNYARSVQSQGKSYFLINQLPDSTNLSLEYILATYLLAQSGKCSLFVTTNQGYGAYLHYSIYDLDFGAVTAATTQVNTDVWLKRYATAQIVNCSGATGGSYPLTLTGTWHSLYSGPSVHPNGGLYSGTVQLQPANVESARVLQSYSVPDGTMPAWLFL